jgi:glucoamylase
VRSAHDGVCFDRVEPAFQRYVLSPVKNIHEIWSLRHPIRHLPQAHILRIIIAEEATIIWSANNWATTTKTDVTVVSALNVWFADLPTQDCRDGSVIEFTFFWKENQRWEGKNHSVAVARPSAISNHNPKQPSKNAMTKHAARNKTIP